MSDASTPGAVGSPVDRGVGRPEPGRCCILHDGGVIGPNDPEGCVLPIDHDGPHEFVAEDGQRWMWETDMECTCSHCMRCEGDYCTVYWPVAYRETPNGRGEARPITEGTT